MADKVDISGFIFDQTLNCAVSKEVLNKHSYDELITAVSPGKNWSLTSMYTGGEEISMTFRNDDHADRFL
jgi:hypothetical protein